MVDLRPPVPKPPPPAPQPPPPAVPKTPPPVSSTASPATTPLTAPPFLSDHVARIPRVQQSSVVESCAGPSPAKALSPTMPLAAPPSLSDQVARIPRVQESSVVESCAGPPPAKALSATTQLAAPPSLSDHLAEAPVPQHCEPHGDECVAYEGDSTTTLSAPRMLQSSTYTVEVKICSSRANFSGGYNFDWKIIHGKSKGKKGQHQCPICKAYGHRWQSCKDAAPEALEAYADVAKKKRDKRKKKCITKSSSTTTDQAIEGTQNALDVPCPSEVIDGAETSSKPSRSRKKKHKVKAISAAPDSPAMSTRSKRKVAPTLLPMDTRSKKKLKL